MNRFEKAVENVNAIVATYDAVKSGDEKQLTHDEHQSLTEAVWQMQCFLKKVGLVVADLDTIDRAFAELKEVSCKHVAKKRTFNVEKSQFEYIIGGETYVIDVDVDGLFVFKIDTNERKVFDSLFKAEKHLSKYIQSLRNASIGLLTRCEQ